MKPAYYVLPVFGGVEPDLIGPYDTEELRDAESRRHRREDQRDDDGLFGLDIDEHGVPSVFSYTSHFFMDDEEE